MAKKLRLLVIMIFMATIMTSTVYAQTDDYLRVGLGGASPGIHMESASVNVFFNINNHLLNVGYIDGGGTFTISADNLYYVFIENTHGGYDLARSRIWGRRAVPVLLESGTWGVYAGPFTNLAEAQSYALSAGATAIMAPNGRRLALHVGGDMVALFENNMFTPYFADARGGKVNVNGYYYRGLLQAHRTGAGLVPVNRVSMEDYLLSVVPSEMPAGWHMHALKAQAVAARSYAYTRAGVHADRGYDLCNTVCCQVYLGMRQEHERTTEAVKGTRGIMAFHDGEVINAVYSSSSGGVTDDSENVWSAASPYLRGRSDVYDVTGREWTRSFTLTELTRVANANEANIGNVVGVQITGVSATGRVSQLTINGAAGSVRLEREQIRTFFSPAQGGSLYSRNFRMDSYAITAGGMALQRNAGVYVMGAGAPIMPEAGNINVLTNTGATIPAGMSNMLVQTAAGMQSLPMQGSMGANLILGGANIVQITGGFNSTGYVVTFVGRGWGHGVGLSQHGARGMAEAGYTFDQILRHYYTGITLQTRADQQ